MPGGELRFRRVQGQGIDRSRLKDKVLQVRLRSGGERLQPDARRPSRTLKNLFQEAGVPPWERERLPLLFCGSELVWAPGLGVDAKFLSAGRATGIVPDAHVAAASEFWSDQGAVAAAGGNDTGYGLGPDDYGDAWEPPE